MSHVIQGICPLCKHLDRSKVRDSRTDEPYFCTSFPDGIPIEIELGKWDHRRPHPEDNGVRFELIDEYKKAIDRIKYPSEEMQEWWRQEMNRPEGTQDDEE